MKTIINKDIEKNVLRLAAFNAIILGTLITLSPKIFLGLFGSDLVALTTLFEFWHIYGIMLGVLGIGYLIASVDPQSNWQFVLVGFLFNLLSSYVFVKAIYLESLPIGLLSLLLFSSFVWLVPFYLVLVNVFDENTREVVSVHNTKDSLRFARTSLNENLIELSFEKNILLVFVREFGCAFCKETIKELAHIESIIKKRNLEVVFVHMSDHEDADNFFAKYFGQPVRHISDPGRSLYKSFNLKRGNFKEIYGVKTFFKSIYLMLFKGYGFGSQEGDGLQLGGAFLLSNGKVVFQDKAISRDYRFNIKKLNQIELL